MSVISLQFGQCGNQIGNCLYSTISEDLNANNNSASKNNSHYQRVLNKWFHVNKHGKWEPRSVLIDTECKVIESSKPLPFKFKNVVAKSSGGSANNWACGYVRHGKIVADQVMNVVRAEVEKCDLLTSFLNIYSSSGGTGSGLGSYIIEQLRDSYPNKNIVNTVVLPYVKGEIVTQSYNSLLTLSHLYSLADSTLLFENERLHYTCKYTLDKKDISFTHLNTIIAQQLAAVYQPLNTDTVTLLNSMTPHPSFKFLRIKSEPQFSKEYIKFECSKSWQSLLSMISKQSRFDSTYQKYAKFKQKTICSSLITMGSDYPTENDLKLMKQTNCVPWLPKESSLKIYHGKQNFLNLDKYLVVISNSNSVYLPLNVIVDDAWNLFNYGAYLHHYKKYDIDEDFFLNAFQVLENILDSYKCL